MMRALIVGILLAVSPPVFATALNVTLVSGTTYYVPYDYTGNGSGFAMGAFDIDNPHTAGLVLHDVTLTATGSGDDSTAFSEVGLFIDSNANGAYDPGVDSRYGQIYTAYPVDEGSLTFTSSVGFAPSEVRRFIVVVKMNGSVVPADSVGFRIIVSSVSATGGAPTGVPTTFSNWGASVFRRPTPLALEYDATGTGPPYDYVFRLVLDNHDGSWAAGQAWLLPIFGQAAFGAGGTAPFSGWVTNSASYPVGPYVTTTWANVTIGGISYNAPGLVDNVAPVFEPWVPTSVGDELTWWGTASVFLNEGEMSWTMSRDPGSIDDGAATLEPAKRVGDYLRVVAVSDAAVETVATASAGGSGFAIGGFDVLSHTNSATLSSITVAGSGTGDDAAAFSSVRLFVDSNGNGAYDPGVDTQFGQSYSAYPVDDGSLTFTGTLNFNPDETKRLLVVVMLNGPTLASYGQTFNTTVTVISATGNMHSGLPTAVMPGIHIEAPTLTLTSAGSALSIHSSAQGPGGAGVQVAEFLLANNAVGVANLASISVDAAGSIFDHSAFSSVALYNDTNASGVYDTGDTLYATTASAFPADDGVLTFSQGLAFAAGQSRRFFLVVKLNGSAQAGDDFWVQLSAVGVSGGTETTGVPGELVNGMQIVANQPQAAVSRNAASVANGGTDALGTIPAGIPQSLTYTIANAGTVALDLTGTPVVAVTPGANISGLSVTTQPATTIGAAGSTTFTLEFTATGAFDFTVSIESNDPGNDPYTWTVTGSTPGSGGGSGSGAGDSGSCSSTQASSALWAFALIAALLAGLRLMRTRRAA